MPFRSKFDFRNYFLQDKFSDFVPFDTGALEVIAFDKTESEVLEISAQVMPITTFTIAPHDPGGIGL